MVSPSRSCLLKLLPMPTKSTTSPNRSSTSVVLMQVVTVPKRPALRCFFLFFAMV